jgi:hypothetical protein
MITIRNNSGLSGYGNMVQWTIQHDGISVCYCVRETDAILIANLLAEHYNEDVNRRQYGRDT